MQRNMSKPASDAGMSISRPLSAADLYQDAYPYPITTTATRVFSRANSFSSPSNRRKQHYVQRAKYHGHRYSSSEDMCLPSASASNANRDYTGGGSGNAPRALPAPPKTLDPRAARRAPQHHGHSRGGCMGPHAQCRWARIYAHGRDGRGGAEADGVTLPPPSAPPRAPSLKKSSHPCPSPRLLPFPTTRAPTATTRPSVASAPPPMRGPHVSCYGRRGRGCRPRCPALPQERRGALASTAPRCVAVRHLEFERILLL
ncbi:hypothetical protein K438DRAFT_1846096 [Mycena galopus ATCC 62051]|nr:hypothetical protein K438DRAFT_1846096 [Mycena galopus ATCC 62051]